MKHLLVAGAAFALLVSAAHAAPGFGGASVSSGESSSATSGAKASPFFAWLEGQVIARLKGDATAPVAKGKRPTTTEGECDDVKKAKEEKQAEAKSGLQGAGPEPIYLAF